VIGCDSYRIRFSKPRGRRASQARSTKNLPPIRYALWGKHFECFAALAESLFKRYGLIGFMAELFSHTCPSLKSTEARFTNAEKKEKL
jgi:hypothetical protein